MSDQMLTLNLGQIGNVRMCKRVLKEQTSESEEIPFFKISTFGDKPDTYISKELFEEYVNKYSYPKKGDILISAAGTLGKIVIFDGKPSYFQDSNIVWIENDEGKLINEYLYYFYKTNPWETTNGSTINRIYNDNLRNIKVTFPKSIQAQQKIAKVLSDLDAKIELNNRINAELEAMAKLVYEYWFVQFDFPVVTLSGVEGYKSSGGKMVWNEELKREIPEGWEVKNIYKCSNVQYGYPFKTEYFNEKSGVPVIRIRDILENTISNFSIEPNVDPKYKIEMGDLLVGMDGNFHLNYWSNPGCYLNQRVVKFGESYLSSMYLRFAIEPFIKLREKSVSRTTVGHLSDKDIRSIFVLIPSKEVLEKSNSFFKSTLEKIIKNRVQNQELSTLRDWLLPMLMNGQVSVAEAEERVEEELGMVAERGREENFKLKK